MKKYILPFIVTCGCIVACNPKDETKETAATTTTASSVALPYTAG